ncbi:hypothetical protein BaRGS_00014337 [Batillaria attramentaria]|uniref:Uncharacterized protein n=1 Tax=Batillaria attramentaria TaxID=370345 RepID=A0ABD0L527_9CAEN
MAPVARSQDPLFVVRWFNHPGPIQHLSLSGHHDVRCMNPGQQAIHIQAFVCKVCESGRQPRLPDDRSACPVGNDPDHRVDSR